MFLQRGAVYHAGVVEFQYRFVHGVERFFVLPEAVIGDKIQAFEIVTVIAPNTDVFFDVGQRLLYKHSQFFCYIVCRSVLNSLAVLAVAYMEHMNMDEIQQELANFSGVKRRFSETDIADTTIIDDYAHHPSEIKATIDAARQKYPDREVIAVFQPHTYSRLAAYIDGFAESLSRADKTFVTPIFGSIRENAGNVSSADLEQRIEGSEGIDMDTMDKLLQYHNAVVVFMGAGDVEKYEEKYKELLK